MVMVKLLVFILYTYTNEDNSNSYQLYKSTFSHTYPFLILDVDDSSLLNKELSFVQARKAEYMGEHLLIREPCMTIESLLTSRCVQGYDCTENVSKKLWLMFPVLAPSRSGNMNQLLSIA